MSESWHVWHGPPRSAVSSFQVCPHSRSSPITIHWSPFSITMSSVRCIQLAELQAKHEENLRLQELHDHAHNDQEYQDLLQLIQAGFPDHKVDLPPNLKKFWVSRSHLSIDDGLPVYGCRFFIPTTFHPTILERLHEAHQGITRSKDRAQLSIYWPGIDQDIDIEMYIADCKLCQDSLSSESLSHVHYAHSNRLPWILRTMEASTFSWWLIALLTGPTSSRWASASSIPF